MALAQHDVAEREHLVERDPVQVAAHVGPRVVLDHHQQAVAKLQPAVRLGQPRARRRRVEAHVPRDRPRLVDTAPAEQPGPPGHVDVGGPQLEVLVEHLTADRARLEHLAAVQHARAVAAEDLGGLQVPRRRLVVADERVLAPPVDHHPGRVEAIEPIGRPHSRRADEARRDGAHPALLQARTGGGEEARVEHAVGVEQQDGVALRRHDPRVDRRRVGLALAQADQPRAEALGDRPRRVGAGVVDDDEVGVRLGGGRGQRVFEQRRLVNAEDEDRRRPCAHSISS